MKNLTSARSVRITQAVWLVLAIAATAAYVLPLASQWVALQTICHRDSTCLSFQLDTSSARTLNQHGISMGAYAVFTTAVDAAVWVIWYGLAALIVWRKPQDRGAFVSAFFLVTFPLLVTASGGFLPTSVPDFLQYVLSVVPFLALLLFGLLFLDGRFTPRWTRWLVATGVLAIIASGLSSNSAIWVILVLVFPIAVVGVQIYRFRSKSSWVQRQQTKWAFFGLVVGILGFVALILLGLSLTQTQNGSLYGGFSGTLDSATFTVIPISIGIAVLRSRLWDIDRIISRALAFTVLSVTLAAIYIGSVIGLQTLFRTITGQQSELAVDISTLVLAALFNPLRHRIHRIIERTFYRRKYNAQQVLAAFGATCRDETDLEKFKHDMLRVVVETMQPDHISLWLRKNDLQGER